MTLVLEYRLPVAAEPAKAWGLLVEPRSWSRWWPAVRDARTADFKPIKEGSRLEADLEMGPLKSTLRAKVALCVDGKSITWDSRWLGVPLRHEWYLEPRADGCRAIARTRFAGAGATLLHWLRLDRRWQQMLTEQVRGLKKIAEQL